MSEDATGDGQSPLQADEARISNNTPYFYGDDNPDADMLCCAGGWSPYTCECRIHVAPTSLQREQPVSGCNHLRFPQQREQRRCTSGAETPLAGHAVRWHPFARQRVALISDADDIEFKGPELRAHLV